MTWYAHIAEKHHPRILSIHGSLIQAGVAEPAARRAALQCVAGDNILSRSIEMNIRSAKPGSDNLVWEAVLIAPGVAFGSPTIYADDAVLERSVAAFNGVDICCYDIDPKKYHHIKDEAENIKRYLTAKKAGVVKRAWFEKGVGILGEIHFFESHKWICDALLKAQKKDPFGLSIDSRVSGSTIDVDGLGSVLVLTGIGNVDSVDVVTHPAAGGRFIRTLQELSEELMNREQLIKILQEKRPDLLIGKDVEQLSGTELTSLVKLAMDAPVNDGNGGEHTATPVQLSTQEPVTQAPVTQAPGVVDTNGTPLTAADLAKAMGDLQKKVQLEAACARTLDATLSESNLPDLVKKRVRQSFEGTVFKQSDLDAAIKSEKDFLAQMNVPGFDDIGDQQRIEQGPGTLQKLQLACDRLIGLTNDDLKALAALQTLAGQQAIVETRTVQDLEKIDDVPRLSGLGEFYTHLTGDASVDGRYYPDRVQKELRTLQEFNSGTFSYLLGNTMHRRLVRDYTEPNFKENLLISTSKSVKDFRTQEAVLIGYFGDISAIDPETEDYQEVTGITDEESTYKILQKGNILTITRKLIINDDMSVIQKLVSRLGRAARRTHAKYVWNFYISNATCSDGTAWFTTPHANLGSSALSFPAAWAAYQALAKMKEKDSGEIIGLLDGETKPTLVYPIDLAETAEQIINDDHYFVSDDLSTKTRNPLKGKINGAQVSLLTDANDWGLLMPPSLMDMVEMGYLQGRKEPELFLADSPHTNLVLVQDRVRYKIRHEYAGALTDYRSGYKAVVA